MVTQQPASAAKPERLSDRLRGYGLLLAGALLLLLVIATPPVKAVRRRMGLRRGHRGPGARVTAAYEILCDEAADVGLGRRPFETPWEYQRRLAAFAPECGSEIERLTDLTVRATYALNGIGAEEADEAATLSKKVSRAIHRASPAVRRVAGMYRIGSWDPGDRWLPAAGTDVRRPASLRA